MNAGITTDVSLPLSQPMASLLQQFLTEIVLDSTGEVKIVVSPKGVQITKTKQRFFPWH